MLLLIGVRFLGLPRRIPTGVVCHPSVLLPSSSIAIYPINHPSTGHDGNNRAVGGGLLHPKCGQASPLWGFVGHWVAHGVWLVEPSYGLWGPSGFASHSSFLPRAVWLGLETWL